MSTNGNVRLITAGQQFELASALVKVVPHLSNMSFETAKLWIGDQTSLVDALSSVLITEPVVIDWFKVYEHLGLLKEFQQFFNSRETWETVLIKGQWKVWVIKGVTIQMVIDAFKKSGVKVRQYVQELDSHVLTNVRDPRAGSYAVSFKANVEADVENSNQTADYRESFRCNDIILLERLLLGFGYFLKTGKHLDVDNETLCCGSRSTHGIYDGEVPTVSSKRREDYLCIDTLGSNGGGSRFRAREVVA